MRRLPVDNHLVHGAALGGAAPEHALDAVFGHELEGARGAALDWLPAFDGLAERPRHEGDVLQRVAAVRHFWRDRVVLALVAEAVVVERLEDDVDLLLEELAVAGLVAERRAEGLDLARVIAAPDTERDAPAGQDVRHRIVLGEA